MARFPAHFLWWCSVYKTQCNAASVLLTRGYFQKRAPSFLIEAKASWVLLLEMEKKKKSTPYLEKANETFPSIVQEMTLEIKSF